MKFKMDLQLFNDAEPIDSIGALDSLLSGNTQPQAEEENLDDAQAAPETPAADDVGGGQNLDSSADDTKDEPQADDGLEQERSKQNAAFARLRAESTQANKLINELAKALGIQESDPTKRQELLLHLAQEKLAKDSNVPVELYKELNMTKEQLAHMQQQQNQITARDKFTQLQKSFELDEKSLYAFAKQLDDEGINVVQDPNIDLEYYYYKMNRQALEEKRIQKAVEEALRNSNAAENKSTTPPRQQSKGGSEPAKVNSVSALEALFNGK